jgi:peroxiredoxin Q/BCP
LGFDLLVDDEKTLAKDCGVFQKKKFMGREFMGIVRSTFVINEKGIIQNVFSPVNVKGHVQEVLDCL